MYKNRDLKRERWRAGHGREAHILSRTQSVNFCGCAGSLDLISRRSLQRHGFVTDCGIIHTLPAGRISSGGLVLTRVSKAQT